MGKSDDKPISPDIKKLIMLADKGMRRGFPSGKHTKTKWENHGTYTITPEWYTYPSEKCEFVSWDDYSQYMENKSHVPNHQPDKSRSCPRQS